MSTFNRFLPKQRSRRIALIVAGASVCIVAALQLGTFLFSPVGRPHSDIPITTDIGNWASQSGLKVTKLSVEAVDPKLGLFNDRFIIRYRIAGTVTSNRGWRPTISRAQVTARRVSPIANDTPPVADILIVPIVSVSTDLHYEQQPIPFEVKLEQVMQTMDWGPNHYEVHCVDKTATLSVQQIK